MSKRTKKNSKQATLRVGKFKASVGYGNASL